MANETVDALVRHSVDQDDRLRALERSGARLDRYLEDRRDAERRQIEDDQRTDAMRADEDKRNLQIKYDRLLRPFEQRAPQAAADESVAGYHKRLLHQVQQRLSPRDERRVDDDGTTIADLARVPVDELKRTARQVLEPLFVKAVETQCWNPHPASLPSDGTLVPRTRVDEMTGAKEIHWFGRHSFIKDMGTPGRRVMRFIANNRVIHGPAFPPVPGT